MKKTKIICVEVHSEPKYTCNAILKNSIAALGNDLYIDKYGCNKISNVSE